MRQTDRRDSIRGGREKEVCVYMCVCVYGIRTSPDSDSIPVPFDLLSWNTNRQTKTPFRIREVLLSTG